MLIWDRDGNDWPNREASRFVAAGGITWHVQQFGKGPPALLLHGTGGSTHSWEWIAPYLKDSFTLIAVDLPGHAFTGPLPGSQRSLPGIASAVGALLRELRVSPVLAIGHSAGAAIMARMALDKQMAPHLAVSINGALLPFPGAASKVFPALARVLYINPFANRFFAWRASQPDAIKRLIGNTGSEIPARSLAIYERLFRSPAHVGGTLAMMGNWNLAGLASELPRLQPRLMQIVGSNDRAIPPDRAFELAKLVPHAKVELLRGPGHLAHEEAPSQVAAPIIQAAMTMDILERLASS